MAQPPTHTTLAVGEEDEPPRKPREPRAPDITTMAVGEEEDDSGGEEPVTTLAVGEEDEQAPLPPKEKRPLPGKGGSGPFGRF